MSECSEPCVRGLLGSLPALFMALGILVTYVVGDVLPWHQLAYFCLAFPLMLMMCAIPINKNNHSYIMMLIFYSTLYLQLSVRPPRISFVAVQQGEVRRRAQVANMAQSDKQRRQVSTEILRIITN